MRVLGTERSILDRIDAAVVVTDLDGTVTHWNPRAESLYGWPADEVLGRNVFEFLIPEAAIDRAREILDALLAGRSWSGEVTAVRRDGSPIDVYIAESLLLDDRGRPQGVIAISFDITKRRQAEQRLALQYGVTNALAEAETLTEAAPGILRSVCEITGWEYGGIWVVDDRAEVLRCVQAWQRDPGRHEAFAVSSRSMSLALGSGIPGRVWETKQAMWVPDMAGDESFPRGGAAAEVGLHAGLGVPILLGDDVVGVMEFFSTEIREPDAGLLGMLSGIGGQIGQFVERKEAESAVRESEARKGAIMEAALDAIVSMDESGRIVEFNPAAERMFGRRRDEVLGAPLAEVLIPPALREQHRKGLARYLRTGEARILGSRVELTALAADGREFPVEVAITRVDAPGPPLFTGYIRDISERRHTETELRRILTAEQRSRAQVEAAQQRLAFLAEAGTVLASALDFTSALEALGRLAVNLVADICLIDILDERGEFNRLVAVHANPEKEELARQLQGRYPPKRGGPHPAARVVESGRPEFSPEMPDEFLRSTTRDEDHFRITKLLGMQSYICVPLIARGRILGTITLVSTDPAHRFGPGDVTLAEDLARRTALTVDNARLFEAEQLARRRAERAAERTAALQSVTAALSEALSSDEVAEVVLARAVANLGASAGMMLRLRSDGVSLEIVRSSGYAPELLEGWQRPSMDALPPVADAIRARSPVFLASKRELSERYPEIPPGLVQDHRSWAVAPMLVERRAIGAIALAFAEARSFSADDGAFLEALARQAAHAFERARLFEAERQARAEAEAARHKLAFLAEASATLVAEVIDYEETLATVARLAVPDFADWCVVDLVGETGGVERVAIMHADPAKRALGREYQEQYPPDPDAPYGVAYVIRTGRPEIYPEIPEEMIVQVARDERHLALLRELAPRSSMIVPMAARGRTVGAITFVWAESNRRYRPEDLVLAEDLARRAALAVDNARLYRDRSSVARTLQQSLLPPRLPPIPGMEVAALYRPAGEGTEIGGDFYDLFETPDHNWAAVIGDVCGKGVDAAAVTGLARYTVRAVAMREGRASGILKTLNDALLQQTRQDRFCTVCFALLRPSGAGVEATICSGGHPLPLVLRADGSVATVGAPGTLLGVFPDPILPDVTVELGRGDALVLYTDGVVEERISGDLFGEERLLEALSSAGGLSAEGIVGILGDRVQRFRPEAPRDDSAILVLKVAP